MEYQRKIPSDDDLEALLEKLDKIKERMYQSEFKYHKYSPSYKSED